MSDRAAVQPVLAAAAGTSARQRQRIERYYREADFDYKAIWQSHRNLARHFGFGAGMGHDASIVQANRRLAGLAGIGAGTVVLDCGCGIGGTSIWLTRELGSRTTGIDLIERQLAQARHEAARVGLGDRVRFMQGDFTATSLGADRFEVVLAQESLCHAERKDNFYREAYRLLRPGGRLLVAEYMRTGRDRSEDDELTMRAWCDGWAMPDLLTGEEHGESARSAGFSRIQRLDVTGEVSDSLARLYRHAVACYPIHTLLRLVGLRTQTQHGNIVAARLQYEALRKGLWFYGLLLAHK
jgi:ubiquinone/menaquinone biosynthesis C-methylase UbiE